MTLKIRHTMIAGTKTVLLISISFAFLFLNSCSSTKKIKASQSKTDLTQTTNKPAVKKDITLTPDEGAPLLKVDQLPEFVGGLPALQKFLRDHIHYPAAAQASKIQGVVFVQFVVKKTGQLANIKVIRGIGGGCDEESVRVVKEMPDWIPGKDKGEVVNVQYSIPISFKLLPDRI